MDNLFNISKVTALPGTFTPSTLYLVQAADADLVEVYLSDKLGISVRHVITKLEINALIDAKLAERDPITINQSQPSAIWTFQHHFPYKPTVKIIDSAEDEVFGKVSYPTSSSVRVEFSAPFSGQAILS